MTTDFTQITPDTPITREFIEDLAFALHDAAVANDATRRALDSGDVPPVEVALALLDMSVQMQNVLILIAGRLSLFAVDTLSEGEFKSEEDTDPQVPWYEDDPESPEWDELVED